MPPMPPIAAPIGDYGPFPPRGAGSFPSSGDIDIWWREPDAASVFDFAERRRNTYHFFGIDRQTTVWRSDPLIVGSQQDIHGVPIGPPDSNLFMAANSIRIAPQAAIDFRAGRGGRRRIYAELHSLRMRGDGVEMLAGEPLLAHLTNDLALNSSELARLFRRSYGEVISWDLTGDVRRDLPGDNHFNVFFGLKFDATANSPAFTIFNKDPVVVVDLGITALPPLDRVTIPQFPHDMPRLYYVKHPTAAADLGEQMAGSGGCCAHAVRGLADLAFRPVSFPELADGVGVSGRGIALRTDEPVVENQRMLDTHANRPFFRKVRNRYVDGVFLPNGITQIASTGTTFAFEDTSAGGTSDAIRHGISVIDPNGHAHPINVQAPTDTLAYQPPQAYGVGLGSNAGITIDIARLREANPEFYLVSLIALMGMSAESPKGSSVRLRVLVDGVEIGFASRRFDIPASSAPISIDLQTAKQFVTLACTSTTGAGNGVFALFQLRGFGKLAGDPDIPYAGPRQPNF
jgi:hypothetical protein